MAGTANLSLPCMEQILGVQHCLKADLDFSRTRTTLFTLGHWFLLSIKLAFKEGMLLSPPILPFLPCALIPLPVATELYPSSEFGCPFLPRTTFGRGLKPLSTPSTWQPIARWCCMIWVHGILTTWKLMLRFLPRAASSRVPGIHLPCWSLGLLQRAFSMQKMEKNWRRIFS